MTTLKELVLYQNEHGAALLELMRRHAEEHEGDLTDIESTLEPWFREQDGLVASKVDAVAWVLDDLEARAAARKTAAEKLRRLAATEEAAAQRLKDYVVATLEAAGKTAVAGKERELRVASSGGVRAVSVNVEPTALPQAYQVTTVVVSADKGKLRDDIERGVVVEGVKLEPRRKRLVVR
jgi:hypothetical protein